MKLPNPFTYCQGAMCTHDFRRLSRAVPRHALRAATLRFTSWPQTTCDTSLSLRGKDCAAADRSTNDSIAFAMYAHIVRNLHAHTGGLRRQHLRLRAQLTGLTSYIVLLLAAMLAHSHPAAAQSRDIRTHSEYGADEGDLRLKFEFYHDMWSERDVKHGKYCEWQAHDRLRCAGFYFDGQQDSLWQSWYLSGKPREACWWENGVRNGKTLVYDRKGRLRTETQYLLGKRHGLHTDYYPNGKVKSIAQYQADVCHGNRTTYSRKGVRKRIVGYAEGRRIHPPSASPDRTKNRKDEPKRKATKPERPAQSPGTPPAQKPETDKPAKTPRQPAKQAPSDAATLPTAPQHFNF